MIRNIILILFIILIPGSFAIINHLMLNFPPQISIQKEAFSRIPPALHDFAQTVVNGESGHVVGLYIPGELALPVGQQPNGNPGYVTPEPDRATQFSMASQYGTIGILAHNDLAGAKFQQIKKNNTAVIIFGDGRIEYFVISEVQQYQALSPTSALSDFVNLENPAEKISAGQLFNRIYATGNRLVLQTCLSANGDPSWGRVFIIARPFSNAKKSHPTADWYLTDHFIPPAVSLTY